MCESAQKLIKVGTSLLYGARGKEYSMGRSVDLAATMTPLFSHLLSFRFKWVTVGFRSWGENEEPARSEAERTVQLQEKPKVS
jgi:hypothetical protein